MVAMFELGPRGPQHLHIAPQSSRAIEGPGISIVPGEHVIFRVSAYNQRGGEGFLGHVILNHVLDIG